MNYSGGVITLSLDELMSIEFSPGAGYMTLVLNRGTRINIPEDLLTHVMNTLQGDNPIGAKIYYYNADSGIKVGSLNAYKITKIAQGKPVLTTSIYDFDGTLLNFEWLD